MRHIPDDMSAFGQLFAPNADFVNVTGSWWKGRASIQQHHAYSHGTIPKADAAVVRGGAERRRVANRRGAEYGDSSDGPLSPSAGQKRAGRSVGP